ncbi:MAG: NAD(+)/NADH kinase [Deltaproteobacteria bacterium]|nr:NAD(+)/NADH kinase [Deltaproteobacteria bacterium]
MSKPRILVIHRRSPYTDMVPGGAAPDVADMFEANDPFVENIVKAHGAHEGAMQRVAAALDERGLESTWCHELDGVDPDSFDLVVTVGGDGTVLHASHNIGDTPVLAVNSSPRTSVGFFTACGATGFPSVLDRALGGEVRPARLFRMSVRVGDEVVSDRVLNDVLFCHDCPASTTRYELTLRGRSEDQVSSGVWVATAAGSTAAIRAAGGRQIQAGSGRLQFAVREPGPCGGAEDYRMPTVTHGFIEQGETLEIRSRSTVARIYIDGPHVDFPVGFGDMVSFTGAASPLNLLGYGRQDFP